jgi:hypothetical protein
MEEKNMGEKKMEKREQIPSSFPIFFLHLSVLHSSVRSLSLAFHMP